MFAEVALGKGGILFPIFFNSNFTSKSSVLNPSISIGEDGTGTFVFRRTNYRYLRPVKNLPSLTSTGSIQYLRTGTEAISSTFFLAQFDFSSSHLNKVQTIKIDKTYNPVLPIQTKFDYSTLEDLRICSINEKFTFLGNIATAENMRRPFYFEIDKFEKNQDHFSLVNEQIIENSYMSKCEKNWLPIERRYGEFVRWPLAVKKSEKKFAEVISIFRSDSLSADFGEHPKVYGGSQFVLYEDGYIAVIHFKEDGYRKNTHRYLHQFFYYDKNLEFVKSSKPFTFLGFDTEFCSGIAVYSDTIYVSFSCNDSLNFVLSFNSSALIWDT